MNKEQCKDALRLMLTSRYFEEKTSELFAKGLIHGTTHLANGQEACQAGLCMALDNDDIIVPTHRCHGFTICKGASPYSMFSEMFGSENGLAKGLGGSMHMPDIVHGNLGASAVVASGVPIACGSAFTQKRTGSENISVAIFGDGATSRGAIHESMNIASVWKLPVLFFCENNHYGMSAPAEKMISISDISKRAQAYSMPGFAVDGNDVESVFNVVSNAVSYIKQGNGPCLIVADTYRQKGHSKSDKKEYRTAEEEQAWLAKDPIFLFEKKLEAQGILSSGEIASLKTECMTGIENEASKAYKDSNNVLSSEDVKKLVYSETPFCGEFKTSTSCVTFREAICSAISDEMSCDPSVILIGEDIGIYGGCFKVTEGLVKKHPNQVLDTPVSEEGFTGLAVGSAITGLRPIVEIMYADFCTLISDPIINHAAKAHFMTGGQLTCPIVMRLPHGSGTGHSSQHTQSPEAFFMNTTGLKIIAPSNASDAYRLLRLAIRDNNPVLFFEHKLLYSETGCITPSDLSIGQAKIVRKGKDLTVVSYSHAVKTALDTAAKLSEQGIECTVVDLCTLKPLDEKTILSAVRKTSRAVIIQDPYGFGGVCSQVCSLISTDADTFKVLKAPVQIISGSETPIPFAKTLEQSSVPTVETCVSKIVSSFEF